MNIIYTISGEHNRKYLDASYWSLRKWGYTDQVTIVTDRTTNPRFQVKVVQVDIPDGPSNNLILKTSIGCHAEEGINLYLSNATIVTNPLIGI